MNEYLISKLKEGRINKGLKQSDVTKCTGIKNTTLSNYENGVTEPDIDTFLQLCEFYELDYAGILAEAYGLSIQGEDFKIKPSEIEYIEKYRGLDPHGKEMVDFTLLKEWERSTAESKIVSMTPKEDSNYVNAAHADDYINAPEELRQSEEDIMDDENF